MPEPAEGALPSVYQLRVLLRGISPLISRRLLVRAEDSIADLHDALQIAFGWDGTHLHRFVIHGREYGHDSSLDPRDVRLCDLGLRRGERFRYEYDSSPTTGSMTSAWRRSTKRGREGATRSWSAAGGPRRQMAAAARGRSWRCASSTPVRR